MRVKPVASTGSTRVTRRAIEIGGDILPAGTLVVAPFDAVHHSPLNWDDPDDFKPVRSLPYRLTSSSCHVDGISSISF